MAAVSVTDDNHRWDDMDANTNVSSIGGGSGAGGEPDFFYQKTSGTDGSVSRKVSSSTGAGFYTTTGGVRDFTAAGQVTWMCKALITNSRALNATGMKIRIGSGTGDYYEYNIADTTTEYPPKESWLILPIDPNESGYADTTQGTPAVGSCDYFAITGAFSSTSKGENVAMDAVDAGTGLYLVGGDGGDTDGVFQDFVDDDEGDLVNGGFGYIHTKEGILYSAGTLYIGQTSAGTTTATVFQDSDVTMVFSDGRVAAGFFGLDVDLGDATTDIDWTSCTFVSRGNTTTTDTRAIFNATGTSGAFDSNGCTFANWASFTCTSACTFTDTKLASCDSITAAGSSWVNCTFDSPTTAANDSFVTLAAVADVPDFDGCTFTSSGTGHAMNLGTVTTTASVNWNCTATGYAGTNGSTGNETVRVSVNSGQTLTINVASGASTPTYYNTGSGDVNIVVNPVTTAVNVKDLSDNSNIENARVLMWVTDNANFFFQASVSITGSGTTATVTHTAHGLTSGDYVWIEGAVEDEYNGQYSVTVTDANTYTYTTSETVSGSPATGTIISTFVVISGLTDSSGDISDTRSYSVNQPISGYVRKADGTPYYKQGNLSGTINSSTGFTQNVQLARDE